MSIIKRYQAALRHRTNPRYMTKDFIVPLYTGTEPDILDDSDTQRESSVYKEFPNDMPIISPKRIQNQPYEQLELADGGSVERRGYASGSPSKLIGRYKIEEKKLNNLRQYLKSLPKNEIILASSLQRKFDVDRGTIKKIVTREFSNQLKLAGDQGSSINIKKVNIEKSKRVEENISKIKNDYVKDLKTKFKYPSGSFKAADAGVSNSDLAIKYFGSDNPTNIARVERLNARFKNEYELKYPKGSTEETSLRRLERKEESRKYLSDVEKDILKRQESQKKLLNNYFKNNPKELLKNEKLKSLIDVSLTKEGDLDFTSRYKTSGEYINLAKEGKLFDVFHTSAVKGEKRNIEYPVNRNIGPSKFNQGFIKQIETFFERTKDDSKYDLKKQTINNYLDSVGYRVQVPDGTYIGAKALSAIDSKTGRLPNIEKTLENLNLPKLSDTSEYIPPKKIAQFIGSIGCPTINKSLGGRVNFSEGSNCYAKGLEKIKSGELSVAERTIAGNFLKEAGAGEEIVSGLLKGGKKSLGILEDVLGFGKGVVGRTITPLVAANSALEQFTSGNYAEGFRKIGDVADLTTLVGYTGFEESRRKGGEEDIKKIIGEKNYAGFDQTRLVANQYDQLEDVKQKLERVKNAAQYSDDPLSSGVDTNYINELEKQKLILEKNLKGVNENEIRNNLLNQGNIIYNDILKRNPNSPKSSEYTFKTATLEQLERQYGPGFMEIYKDDLNKSFGPDLTILDKQQDTPFEEPVIQSSDDSMIQNQYNDGGRVGLAGGGPKMGRRGFLGLLTGIAAAPELIKTLKGTKKVAQVAKLLPKVDGMPEWFPSLVARIEKEGTDISPKATRVEDIRKVKKIEIAIPGKKESEIITMTKYPNGAIHIEADVYGGSFDSPFDLHYRPAKTDIDLETGKAINEPGEFIVMETRPRPAYEPGDFELEYESMSVKDAISDIERIEKIATGKKIDPKIVEQRAGARKFIEENPYEDIVNRYPDPEIDYDIMKDEGLFDEIK